MDAEEGRIGILFVVLLGIVALVSIVGANVASVHLQHRQALACADTLALAAVSAVDEEQYFCRSCPEDVILVEALSEHVVHEELGSLVHSTCNVGDVFVVDDVFVEGRDVRVAARVQTVLPFIPGFLDSLVAPLVAVEGQARLISVN